MLLRRWNSTPRRSSGPIRTYSGSDYQPGNGPKKGLGFDYEAGAQHARVNFLTDYLIAQETDRPTWNAGDFFGGLFGS